MTLDDLIEGCWESLRPAMFRRAILGKERCARLVMEALAAFPDAELRNVAAHSPADRKARKRLAATVEAKFREAAPQADGTYNAVFMTIVLSWAVQAIVNYLMRKWFGNEFSIRAIREQYGWHRG